MSIQEILQFAQNPSSEYRAMPLWVWNTNITEAMIDQTLSAFAEQGLGGAFIHPRPGLVTEYLSEDWFRLWGYALERSKSLGMELHIYDEDTYPSGFAGGHVYNTVPDSASRYLKVDFTEQAAGNIALGDGRYITVTEKEAEESRWTAGFPMVDCTNPAVVKTFIECTHKKYAEHFHADIGGALKYAFFDEPEIAFRIDGAPSSQFIRDRFRQDTGYEFMDALEAYYVNGPKSSQVRFDYHQTLHNVWLDNFIKPLCEWGEENGIAITGHEMEHCWPDPTKHATTMSVYRWMQVPGLDFLGFQYSFGDKENNKMLLMNLKELNSVVNQLGKKRALSEIHGGGGNDYALQETKQTTGYNIALGVNLLSPHLSYQTICGQCKYDFPQTFTEHSQWFQYYKQQADAEGRLSYLMSQGHEQNSVLLLHPSTSAWLFHLPACEGMDTNKDQFDQLRSSQLDTVQYLSDTHVPFDLGDEFIMQEFAQAEKGVLKVGQSSYRHIIIPENMTNMLSSTYETLQAFMEAGGTVFSVVDNPSHIDGRAASEQLAELCAHKQYRSLSSLDSLGDLSADENLHADVLVRTKILDDGSDISFYFNAGVEPVSVDICLTGAHAAELDVESGDLYCVPTQQERVLESGEYYVFVSAQEQITDIVRATASTEIRVQEFDEITRLSENVLVLDYCDLTVNGKQTPDLYAPTANKTMWQDCGEAHSPWALTIQYKNELKETRYDGDFSATYRFELSAESDSATLESLSVAIERPHLYSITVNGVALSFAEAEQWLDHEIKRVSIATLVKTGVNIIEVRCDPITVYANIAPIYLLGDFSAQAGEPGFVVGNSRDLQMGNLASSEGGLPFYNGVIRYVKNIEIMNDQAHFEVHIPEWSGACANICIDGQQGALLYAGAQQATVHMSLSVGSHTVTVDLVGVPKNTLGPHFFNFIPVEYAWLNNSVGRKNGEEYIFEPLGFHA